MKDLIFLTEEFPYPATTGGKVAAATLLAGLTSSYRVHLFCLIAQGAKIPDTLELGLTSLTVRHSRLDTHRHPIHTGGRILNSWRAGLPFTIRKAWDSELKRRVDEKIAHLDHPVILAERLQTVQYVREYPYYLIEHNVEYSLAHGRAALAPTSVERTLWKVEGWLLKSYERSALMGAKAILALSPEDRTHLVREFHIDPHRIEQAYLPVTQRWGEKTEVGRYIAVIGSAVWYENATGLRWFLNTVFPSLPADIPLLIAGKSVKKVVEGNNSPALKVIEEFNSVADLVNDIRVLVVPVQNASGIRMKILQALDAGVPVVTTTAGAKGLPDPFGIGLRVEDFPNHMAKALASVYYDEGQRAAMIQKGRNFVSTLSLNVFSDRLRAWLG